MLVRPGCTTLGNICKKHRCRRSLARNRQTLVGIAKPSPYPAHFAKSASVRRVPTEVLSELAPCQFSRIWKPAIWTEFGESWQRLVDSERNSAEFGRSCPILSMSAKAGSHRAKAGGSSWRNMSRWGQRTRRDAFHTGPSSAKIGPELAKLRHLSMLGRELVNIGPTSGHQPCLKANFEIGSSVGATHEQECNF